MGQGVDAVSLQKIVEPVRESTLFKTQRRSERHDQWREATVTERGVWQGNEETSRSRSSIFLKVENRDAVDEEGCIEQGEPEGFEQVCEQSCESDQKQRFFQPLHSFISVVEKSNGNSTHLFSREDL